MPLAGLDGSNKPALASRKRKAGSHHLMIAPLL
jgi:hypothetical protein